MRVLGIDPSYERTGVATAGDARSLTPPGSMAELPPLARASRRRAWLRGRLAPLYAGVDLIAVEGMFPSLEYGILDRAALLGTILDSAYATGAAVLVISPSSVKTYATGNGNAPKSALQAAAAYHFRRAPCANADEADARWIAALAHELAGDPVVALSATHRRALAAYRGPYTRRHPDPWLRRPTTGRTDP